MNYRVTWEEWKELPDGKKLEFWRNILPPEEPVSDDTLIASTVYIPTLIELIAFLFKDRVVIDQNREELVGWLWQETKKKLTI